MPQILDLLSLISALLGKLYQAQVQAHVADEGSHFSVNRDKVLILFARKFELIYDG